jgi:hypothetical protein
MNTKNIENICQEYDIQNYTINSDGTVDVEGNVDISKRNLSKLPLKFGRVTGGFYCYINKLTTLLGCPMEVGGDFWCYRTQLTTLESDPDRIPEVGGDFDCHGNKLTTLLDCPKEVGGSFICDNNQLTIINDELEFVKIMGNLHVKGNPIYEVYKLFPNFKSFQYSLDYNYFRAPNQIVKHRFEEACGEAGIKIPKIIKRYQYI